ncbi:MAG: AarF/UbiB family protein, partial [Streptosporangiaceae bacterium]
QHRAAGRAGADQVATRTAEQLFGTLGELKGGAAKLGQAMSVFEAALPEELAAPYRAALRRLTDAAPPMPAESARRVVAADLGAAFGPDWRERLVAFGDTPLAAASIGQVHRGRWRDDGGQIVEVAVKVQYPGVGQALRSDLRQARLLGRVMTRLTRLNVTGLADELALRIVEELDDVREGRVQSEVAAAFADRVPEVIAGLFAHLGATVPTRGFQLAYSPGFRGAQRLLPRSGQAGRWAEAGV